MQSGKGPDINMRTNFVYLKENKQQQNGNHNT